MPSILVLYTSVLLNLNLLESSLTLVQNIWLSPPFCAMTRPLETTNLRNTTLFQEVSLREIKLIRDVRLWHSICINPRPKKYCQKHHPNWPMAQPSCKVSSGKITLVFSPLAPPKRLLWPNYKMNLRRTSAHSSNSYHFISLKDLDTTLMVFLVCLLTKTWRRRDFITCGHWRITELLIEPWFLSQLLVKKWEKLHMLFSEVIIPHKL